MIRIIKQGSKMSVECQECGCIFTYEKEDIDFIQIGHNEYRYFLDCPCCRKEIEVQSMK